MTFIQVILSFLPTWVYNLVNRNAADKVVPQPDHQVTQKPEIKPRTHPESSSQKARRCTKACADLREINSKLQSDLNLREYEHQQEFTRYQSEFEKLKQRRAVLAEKNTRIVAMKDEQLQKMRNCLSNRDVIQLENEKLRSELDRQTQKYQKEFEMQKQREMQWAEEKRNILAVKNKKLEKLEKLLTEEETLSWDLKQEIRRQKKILSFKRSECNKAETLLEEEEALSRNLKEELRQKEEILSLKNSEFEKMERLVSDQENLYRNLKEAFADLGHSKEELAAKLLTTEAESMSKDSLIEQLNEECNKARDSNEQLTVELSNKEAEYLTISQVKDDRIKELELALSAIKEKTIIDKPICTKNLDDLDILHESDSLKSSATNEGVQPETPACVQLLPEMERGPLRKVYDRHTLMQPKNFVAPIGIREHLVDLGILRGLDSFEQKPPARTFGQMLPEKKQGCRPKREIKLMRSQENSGTSDDPNVWKPKRALMKTEGDVTSTEASLNTVRGILNKLTPSNYKKLLQKIQDVHIDNQDCLAGIIKIFFAKAVDEPIFSPIYAKMCLALSTKDVLSSSNPAETVSFRKLLLFHCQKEFEKDSAHLEQVESKKKEVEGAELLQQELNELVDKNRRVSLGNIKFIGELFKVGVITFNTMHKCIRQLLNQHEDEESLECLCKLLITTGKEIEMPLITDKTAKVNRVQFMTSVIQRLETILEARRISNRLRFTIQGVLELRKAAWKPRRAENGPSVIE